MVSYFKDKINEEIIEFCRFPIPRTPIQIINHLKKSDSKFYQKTEASRVVSFLREKYLKNLEYNGILIKYNLDSKQWKRARYMVKYHYSKSPEKSPRKLTELYQINFLYLKGNPEIGKLPAFSDINLDLVVLFYNFLNVSDIKFYTYELLNLFYSYSIPEHRDKIRIQLYQLNFSEREQNILERALDYHPDFKEFFDELPFRPDPDRAIQLLTKF